MEDRNKVWTRVREKDAHQSTHLDPDGVLNIEFVDCPVKHDEVRLGINHGLAVSGN